MGLPDVVPDFDKAHRIGQVKTINGKKAQDVIVRFKSHSARYKVYKNRKRANNIRILPNLTKRRSGLLYEAIQMTNEKINGDWGFVFANQHGDLLIRTNDKYKGKHYFEFTSIDSLTKPLHEIGPLTQDS